MADLLHELIFDAAGHSPQKTALIYRDTVLDYATLSTRTITLAGSLAQLGLARNSRVAVWLDKRMETVLSFFSASLAGCIFVPINPILKEDQVLHILQDCSAALLICNRERFQRIAGHAEQLSCLKHAVIVDPDDTVDCRANNINLHDWAELANGPGDRASLPAVIDTDLAAILYTSGSTGRAKGVVLSHRNMVAGAKSVAQYLGNKPEDKLLAVLPLSFDAGLSQITTAFRAQASVVLMNYLLPQEIPKLVERHQITGIGAVPPVWIPLSRLDWPVKAQQSLRYITNTGGAMPVSTLEKLRTLLPQTKVYLMYGLTEAFRSTYLPPEELDRRPESMGKAIPNAEIQVVRPDGSECAANEPGELVHRGALVAQGYWNDPEKTAERFKPAPGQLPERIPTEFAVWSGDTVRRDEEGFLYFVGRVDEMIKTSGYRVSPTEIEELVYASGMVAEAVAFGIPDEVLGQRIVLLVVPVDQSEFNTSDLVNDCRARMPGYMVPAEIIDRDAFPRNPNGKIDRVKIRQQYAQGVFA